VLEIRFRGGSGSPDVLSLHRDCAEQVQLGQYCPCQRGPQYVRRQFGFAVLVVRCQKEESLWKVQLLGLRCLSVHTIMVAQSGSRHNGDPRGGATAGLRVGERFA
jgi:hypothetical protein